MKKVGRRSVFKPGYVRHQLTADEQMPGWSLACYSRVLLPHPIAQALDDTVQRKADRAIQRSKAKSERAYADIKVKKTEPEAAEPAFTLPLWCGLKSVLPQEPRFVHILYDEYGLEALERMNGGRSGSSLRENADKRRVTNMVARWRAMTGTRELAAPVANWRDRLDALAIEMPNFAAVIDYLRGEFALAELGLEPVRLAPMLLDGPPGIGKTKFARALASIMNSGFGMISMETAQTATALSGSEEYWSNSKPGMLFGLLMEEQYSNPVILIDEVDKAAKNNQYDPLAALYTLLEPTSAKHWFDLALPLLKLDASKVIWVLTSNDVTKVPKPLLTRIRVFDIAGLNPEQSREMAVRLFSEMVDALPVPFEHALPTEAIDGLAAASPREMRQKARELIAKAVLAGRRHVLPDDLPGAKMGMPVTTESDDRPKAKTVRMRVYEAEVEIPPSVAKPSTEPAEDTKPEPDQAPEKMKMH